ncbi:MAG: hypothetical protein JWM98_1263, partial [Thermoleophilia bacterium]|nr:hypothetical protein [Thermoleophilia bacterium]
MDDEDLDDELWGKLSGPADGADAPGDDDDDVVEVEVGPPIRVTFVVRADKVPVAPWAQGWRVGAIGPDQGQVMLVCEHDIELSPVAQLSAITGLLGTFKAAKLDIAWWAIQTRGPVATDGSPMSDTEDLDSE